MKNKKKAIDWKGIEKDFRAGKTSTRQLAEWYEVSEGAIRKRAKAENWAQLKRPDDSDVGTFQKLSYMPPMDNLQEAKAVVTEGKSLALRMLDELGATTSRQGELEDMIIDETAGDRDGRRRQSMMRAVDLPVRAKTLKDLMLAAKTAIEVQRMEQSVGDSKTTGVSGGQGANPSNPSQPSDDWDHLLN